MLACGAKKIIFPEFIDKGLSFSRRSHIKPAYGFANRIAVCINWNYRYSLRAYRYAVNFIYAGNLYGLCNTDTNLIPPLSGILKHRVAANDKRIFPVVLRKNFTVSRIHYRFAGCCSKIYSEIDKTTPYIPRSKVATLK